MKCIFILALVCLTTLAHARISVVAGNAIIADWVQQVGGKQVTVTPLAGPGADPHHFAPTPKDIARLADADLIVCFGAGLEPWLQDALAASGARAKVLRLTDNLDLMAPGEPFWKKRQPLYPDAESQPPCCREDAIAANQAWAKLSAQMPASAIHDHGHHDHHGHHHHHEEQDPHVWMDPRMALLMVLEINAALNQLEPKHSQYFDERREQYLDKLLEFDAWAQAQIDSLPVERRLLVSYHDNLRYLARAYGLLTPASILGSVSTESADPSARQFMELIATIKELRVPAVFVDSTANPRLAEQVVREASLPAPVTLYTGNLSGPDGPAPDYLSQMRYNVTAIAEALETSP